MQELHKSLKKNGILFCSNPRGNDEGWSGDRFGAYYEFDDIKQFLENAGFKMGPFRLMDLIGMDINLAVSRSVYHALNDNPRFKPSPMQEQKVAAGELGRKTGKGFYIYPENPVI